MAILTKSNIPMHRNNVKRSVSRKGYLCPVIGNVIQLKSSVKSILRSYPWAALGSQSSFKLVFNCEISECKVEPGKLASD
jgi:hypothetical protein